MMRPTQYCSRGFTLVETMFGMVVVAILLVAIAGIFVLFQKSSAQTRQFAEAQQNARVAIDFITDDLRQAGASTDYFQGQRFIVHAGPYQVGFNADIDNGQTVSGNNPLESIDVDLSPNTVPVSGATIYAPPVTYDSEAETVVFTLDSNADGTISAADRGDDPEEDGINPNLFVLRRYAYGADGTGSNQVYSSNLALVRGPGAAPDGTLPTPLFQYYYDHDDDAQTPLALWGDASGNGVLEDTEIAVLGPVTAVNLNRIRKIEVNVTSESDKYNKRFEDNGGFLAVDMNSEVYVRNAGGRATATIYGQVFVDVNQDGKQDAGENGIPNVNLKLIGTNLTARTNGMGLYYFRMGAGNYTIEETDPPGFASTTPNLVDVSLVAGQAMRTDFGDRATVPTGVIKGAVFDDANQSTTRDADEPGIGGVQISLDSGEMLKTDPYGNYSFVVRVGSYNVVEVDAEGYGSTTPNAVTAVIADAGDSAIVDFGDVVNPTAGYLEGYVFEDVDADGVFDNSEHGIATVTLTLSNGDSTVTNASGFYQFSLMPGQYDIEETDPPGYSSTTVNRQLGVVIEPDTTVVLNFGDILENAADFIEIDIGNSARALSVDAFDMKEDNKLDVDLVVGTPFSKGAGNLLVFHNARTSSQTALAALFDPTPTYQRAAGHNINTLASYDFQSDGNVDVFSGLQYSTGNNMQIWVNETAGRLGNTPITSYLAGYSSYVMASKIADFNRDGIKDLVVGLVSSFGTMTGSFQTFRGVGKGVFEPWREVTSAGEGDLKEPLGEVWTLDVGDVDRDGDLDIVVGSTSSSYWGYIDVFLNKEQATGEFVWSARYFGGGRINALKLIDMAEDNAGDLDLLVGISSGSNAGALFLWLNERGVFGQPAPATGELPLNVKQTVPNDKFDAGGEVLSLDAERLNADVFPEVFVGTRASSFYGGNVVLLETFGLLPTGGRQINTTSKNGEAVSMKIADFNSDGFKDVVVGTRTSPSQGKLFIFFYNG